MNQGTPAVFRTLQRRRPVPGLASGAPDLPSGLGEALAEAGTILVLVFGTGREADAAEARCRALAGDPAFEGVRVVRVADRRALTVEQREQWLRGAAPGLAVLGADRRRAVRLARPDAVELFVAVSMVAAA